MQSRNSRPSSRLRISSNTSYHLSDYGWRRRALCLALILGLIIVPDAGYVVRAASSLAAQVAKDTVSPIPDAFNWVKRLSRRPAKSSRQETLADRQSYVSRLQITPLKLVGYQGQATALPLNFNGETIQGVRFDWESSDNEKVQIDDSGRATFLQPGLARITCRVGSVSASVSILVRPGSHPLQGASRSEFSATRRHDYDRQE